MLLEMRDNVFIREWQPITSAPKDETWVLVYQSGGDSMHVAQFREGAWWTSGFDQEICYPWWWMPLPLPPNGDKD